MALQGIHILLILLYQTSFAFRKDTTMSDRENKDYRSSTLRRDWFLCNEGGITRDGRVSPYWISVVNLGLVQSHEMMSC